MASPQRQTTNPAWRGKTETDEDLDDLDEVLDQFTTAPIPASVPPKPTSALSPGRAPPKPSNLTSPPDLPPFSVPSPPPPTATIPASSFTHSDAEGEDEDDLTADFARELQRGMESLMRDMLEGGPGETGAASVGTGTEGGTKTTKDLEQERAFKAAWESLLVKDMDGMVGDEFKPSSSSSSSGAIGGGGGGGAEGPRDFQAGIRAAVDKLKSSESGFKSPPSTTSNAGAAPSPSSSADPLEAFLSRLNGLDDEGEGEADEENEEELRGMLELMMNSLMSKEVLYEPLKELGDKYPPYLQSNATTLSPADTARYTAQMGYVTRILKIFEDPGYSDEDREKGKAVVELMGQMQACGSPPTEIMGELPPGFNLGADGMPQMPEGCCVS